MREDSNIRTLESTVNEMREIVNKYDMAEKYKSLVHLIDCYVSITRLFDSIKTPEGKSKSSNEVSEREYYENLAEENDKYIKEKIKAIFENIK